MSTFIERSKLFLSHRESWRGAAKVSHLNPREIFTLAAEQMYADAAYVAFCSGDKVHDAEFSRVVQKLNRSKESESAVSKNLRAMRRVNSLDGN